MSGIYEITREAEIEEITKLMSSDEVNFFDQAVNIQKLIEICGLTQEEAARRLGKAQSTIANKLRLLRLSDAERDLIINNYLTERHARAILKIGSAEDRLLLLEKIIDEKLNVERTEKLVEEYLGLNHQKNPYKKRTRVMKNVKYFIQTINKAVESMQTAGISVDSDKIQHENYIEYRVRIPLNKK